MTSIGIAILLVIGCAPKSSGIEDQLEREVQALQFRMHLLEAEARQCADGTAPDALFSQLRQIFYDRKDIVIERDGRTTRVSIPWSLVFEQHSGRALNITVNATRVFDLMAAALLIHRDHTVRIISHSNSDPMSARDLRKWPTHWEWAFAASRVIATLLTDRFDVAPERLVLGSGGYHWIESSDDAPVVVVEITSPLR